MLDRLAFYAVDAGEIDPQVRDRFLRTSAGYLGLCHQAAPEHGQALRNGTASSPSRHTVTLYCENILTEEINSEQNTSTP